MERDTKETLRTFEETVNGYIRAVEHSELEQLLWKPAEDEWSLGQMYMHLIGSAQMMQLRNAALCLEPGESPEGSQASKTVLGVALFRAGSFPPERVQVPPSPQYTPSQPESKEQLIEGLRETTRRMTELEPRIAAVFDSVASARAESSQQLAHRTVLHPRMGGLNALEWFQLVEMHYRHHLHQKLRLEDAWREAQR